MIGAHRSTTTPQARVSPFLARVIKHFGAGLHGITIVSSPRWPVRTKPISVVRYFEGADTFPGCLTKACQCLPGVTAAGLDPGRYGTAYRRGRE
jgi:hypothetical protein